MVLPDLQSHRNEESCGMIFICLCLYRWSVSTGNMRRWTCINGQSICCPHCLKSWEDEGKDDVSMDTITVRDAKLEDAPRILEIYAYYVEHTAITFEYDVPTLSGFQSRMKKTLGKYPYLVIEKDGVIQGYAYAGTFVGRAAYDWACEVTVYLHHKAQKCGLGKKNIRSAGKQAERNGNCKSVCLYRVSGGGRCISQSKQCRIPCTSGL